MKKLYNIYNNVITMLTKYREMTLKSKVLNFDEFNSTISHNEFVIINSYCDDKNIRGETNGLTVLVSPDSDIASKSADFKKLYNKIDPLLDKVVLNNVCFITKTPLTSHINKIIGGWSSRPNMYIEDHVFDIFGYEIFLHNAVPKCKLVNIDWFFEQYYLNEKQLPQINSRNAPAVWIGARPGSIIEFQQLSVNVGYSEGYAICVSERIRDVTDEESGK